MDRTEYIQMKAFARQDGAIMGLFWIFSFTCFIASQQSAFMGILFNMTLTLTPFVVAILVRRYRDGIIGGMISFRRSYAYSLFILLNASLILGLAQWAYFQFLDNGSLVNNLSTTINMPEMKPIIDAYGVDKKELDSQMALLSESRPIDFVFSIFVMNGICAFILSWVIALFSMRTRKK